MRLPDRSRGSGEGGGRAISPAVGVTILLVIAVVVAGILGAVATQLVTGDTKPPSATVFAGTCQTPDGDSVLKLQHHGGDVIEAERLRLLYRGVAWRYVPENGPDAAVGGVVQGRVDVTGDEFSPGDSILLGHTAAELDLSSSTVLLVWEDGESGYILSRWNGADGEFDGLGTLHCPFPPPGSTPNTQGYNVTIGECEWTPGADDKGHGNQCSVDDDTDNPGK